MSYASQAGADAPAASQSVLPRSLAPKAETACFHVVADCHPGTLGRLLEVVAKRGLVPSYMHSVRGGRRGDELAVDLQVEGLDAPGRDLVAAQLRAVVTVRTVLSSVKSFVD